MRSLLLSIFVISLACWACGPISDWPQGAEGPQGFPTDTHDAGSGGASDSGAVVLDAGGAAGGAGPLDASLPTGNADAASYPPCGFDGGDASPADAGDAQVSDGGVEPALIDGGSRAPFRPLPPWWYDAAVLDAQLAPADAGQGDAESDLTHTTTAPWIPCQ